MGLIDETAKREPRNVWAAVASIGRNQFFGKRHDETGLRFAQETKRVAKQAATARGSDLMLLQLHVED